MKLNKHLKELEKEQKDVQKATKRVYKILGVSDEFVPNLEALIKNDAKIKNSFNQLLDFQLNHKNDLTIERLKFWIPTLAWAALTVSLFGAGANLAGQTNEEMAKIGADLICSGVVSAGLGVYIQIMAWLKADVKDDIWINEDLQDAKAEARKNEKAYE